MLISLVSGPGAGMCEVFATYFALEWLFTCVDPPVFHYITPLMKCFVTQVTLEVSIASVKLLMGKQRGIVGKLFVAPVTLVLQLPRVDLPVVNKVAVPSELLITHLTFMGLPTAMRPFMFDKLMNILKLFTTDVALEALFFAGVELHVKNENGALVEDLVAFVTFIGLVLFTSVDFLVRK